MYVWSLLLRGRSILNLDVNRSEDWWREEEEHRIGLYRKADSLTFIGTLDLKHMKYTIMFMKKEDFC